MADQVIDDTFSVTGQNTEATFEGVGTLDYTISVEEDKAIGDAVKFTITPVNENLVYATVKEGLSVLTQSFLYSQLSLNFGGLFWEYG